MSDTHSPETAILLLAGQGRRLGELTADIPKCLLEVAGISILERSLRALSAAGYKRVALVVGYRADAIREFAGDKFGPLELMYVDNERFSETNTAYSLWLARDYLDAPVALIEGDIVFDASVMTVLHEAAGTQAAWAAVPVAPRLDEGILLEPGPSMRLRRVELVRDPDERSPRLTYKCGGIQLLDHQLAQAMAAALGTAVAGGGERVFADLVLGGLLDRYAVTVCSVADERWAEVDDNADLEAAAVLFSPPSSVCRTGT